MRVEEARERNRGRQTRASGRAGERAEEKRSPEKGELPQRERRKARAKKPGEGGGGGGEKRRGEW